MNTSEILWALTVWVGLSVLVWATSLLARGVATNSISRVARSKASLLARFGAGGALWISAVYCRILAAAEESAWWLISGPDSLFVAVPFFLSIVGLAPLVGRVGGLASGDGGERKKPSATATALGAMSIAGVGCVPAVGWWVLGPALLSYGLGSLVLGLTLPVRDQPRVDNRRSSEGRNRGAKNDKSRRGGAEGGRRKPPSGGRETRSGKGGAREAESRGSGRSSGDSDTRNR